MSNPRKERKSRILPLLGPAAALYLIADAASATQGLDTIGWIVAAMAVALTATPLWLRGLIEGEVGGARRTGLLGVLLGLALAASMGRDAVSLVRDLTLAVALASSGAIVIDLGLRVPDVITRRGRGLVTILAVVSSALGGASVLPPFELFGELVLAPSYLGLAPVAMFVGGCTIALVVRLFRRRFGSTPEALASNAWAVMGLVPSLAIAIGVVVMAFRGIIASTSVPGFFALSAPVLLFGHVTAIDARRRPRAGRAVRRYVAGAFTATVVAGAVVALFEHLPPEPVTFGVATAVWWGLGVVVWRAAQRGTHRLLAPYGGRLLDALERVRPDLGRATSLDEIAGCVLSPLRDASGDLDADPVMWVADPGREARLDAARNPRVRSGTLPPSVQKIFDETPGRVVVANEVHAVVVRRPERRALSELLETQDALCLVPLRAGDHIEGAIVVPRGRRGSALSLEEIDGLRDLGEEVAAMVSLVTARDRAQRRLGEVAQERDRLEEQVDQLEDSLERLQADAKALAAGRGASRRVDESIAYSESMRALEERIRDVAPMEVPATLMAEGGTPIDRVARAIHGSSARKAGPFVVADCASVRSDDGESALFGDESRPGWLRLAGGGTLLLADVPALSLDAQRALAEALAVKQGRPADGGPVYPIDVRVVATTRAELGPLADAGLFDAELARWLTRMSLAVPPLRERREDIPSLVLLALDRSCRVLGRPSVGIDQGAIEVLLRHDWPGNLRELQHVIDRAVSRTEGAQVQRRHLPALAPLAGTQSDPLEGTYAELERRVLLRAMKKAGGNKSEAARILGLKRTTFLDKLRRHDLKGTPKKTAQAEGAA